MQLAIPRNYGRFCLCHLSLFQKTELLLRNQFLKSVPLHAYQQLRWWKPWRFLFKSSQKALGNKPLSFEPKFSHYSIIHGTSKRGCFFTLYQGVLQLTSSTGTNLRKHPCASAFSAGGAIIISASFDSSLRWDSQSTSMAPSGQICSQNQHLSQLGLKWGGETEKSILFMGQLSSQMPHRVHLSMFMTNWKFRTFVNSSSISFGIWLYAPPGNALYLLS